MIRIEADVFYTLDDLSEMFGVARRTWQRVIYSGRLPARKVGNALVVLGSDLLTGLPSFVPGSRSKKTGRKRKG